MSRKKDTYWHNTARIAIEHGFKPAQVAKIIKSIFPQSDVTGRHVGAYKRRLTTDGEITNVLSNSLMSLNEMVTMVADMVSAEDRFVYDCSIGSQIQSLKCFEYKLTAEETDELKKVEAWIKNMKK
tara:strand:- start:1538 stop:1915 length:378 start_codon:yes stop_codon:yes gene_type:complete